MKCTQDAERVLWYWQIMRGDCMISNVICNFMIELNDPIWQTLRFAYGTPTFVKR